MSGIHGIEYSEFKLCSAIRLWDSGFVYGGILLFVLQLRYLLSRNFLFSGLQLSVTIFLELYLASASKL